MRNKDIHEVLIEISTNHPDPVHATPAWRHKAYGTVLCHECHRIDRKKFPLPCDVVLLNHPGNRIISGIWYTNIEIVSAKFIEQLSEYLTGFALGKCLTPKGDVIDEYVTCYGKDYLIVRGDKRNQYKICGTCNMISSGGWDGPRYILRSYLRNTYVYQSSCGSIFLDEKLAIKLDFSPWPDSELIPIAIRDEPLDGQVLPIDPCYEDTLPSNTGSPEK
jgi:hypothetical protein